ncbi:mitochondrial fission ELM1 family protein [Phenylobacterium parvum]|uniref:Nucleoside-diphosphate sugar epimerase n=1 Tax=Phenylobacterium parvum TaxID=2201350 RepID=A0A2Z3HS05_9CAUL|nr:mitochondrial fission ELM1 family protein [Phenylobacterium parvum]AWM76956.1 nucleoside-diphosphate sugar epimerase [Phenylobacterium parvum]
MARPLTLWAVSDDKAGNAGPALGLAEAVARLIPARVETRTVRWKGRMDRLPWFLNPFPLAALEEGSDIRPPWPDLWIAAGRATLPLSLHLKSWSRGRTRVVQIQNPRTPRGAFDLVVAPRHDQISGPNVLPVTGSPHRVTAERLAEAAARFAPLTDPLPRPRAALLVGGKSKTHDLSDARARTLAADLRQAVTEAGGSLMTTFSRRTPASARRILTEALSGLPGFIWDGTGENPYFAFLAAADVVLVTEDSANMATEAASSGRPVLLLPLDGGSDKFTRLHEDLIARGAARRFEGRLDLFPGAPFDETGRAAAAIVGLLDQSAP